jgi:hypothetical protein
MITRIDASAAPTNAEAYYAEQFGMSKQVGVATTETVVTTAFGSKAVAAVATRKERRQ